jgi:hypothetical protein
VMSVWLKIVLISVRSFVLGRVAVIAFGVCLSSSRLWIALI